MYDDLLSLRALRSFTDTPVSDDDLHRLLEALRWTGSSKNRQAWSWVVVGDPDQRNDRHVVQQVSRSWSLTQQSWPWSNSET